MELRNLTTPRASVTVVEMSKSTKPPDVWLTVDDIASVLGLSTSSTRRLLAEADPIPSTRIGALRRLVRPGDLRAWATRREFTMLRDPAELAQPWPRPEVA